MFYFIKYSRKIYHALHNHRLACHLYFSSLSTKLSRFCVIAVRVCTFADRRRLLYARWTLLGIYYRVTKVFKVHERYRVFPPSSVLRPVVLVVSLDEECASPTRRSRRRSLRIFIASRNCRPFLGRHFRGTVRRSAPVILDRAIYTRKYRGGEKGRERERERVKRREGGEKEEKKKREERWQNARANLVRRRRHSSREESPSRPNGTLRRRSIWQRQAPFSIGEETPGNRVVAKLSILVETCTART